MKKAAILSSKIVGTILILIAITYSAFRLNEFFIGNKYVHYLKQNHLANVPITDSISLHFDTSFFKNQLYLVGEVHEIESSPIIDVSTFKYLNQNNNVNTYIAEMDIPQAYYLNQYLIDSTTLDLKEILKEWVIRIGQNSQEYRNNKWGKLKQYYQQIDISKKFKVYGVDRLNDFDLLYRLLSQKIPVNYLNNLPHQKDSLVNWGATTLPEILKTNSFCTSDSLLLSNLAFNCQNREKIKSRDEFMYENLKRYYHQNHWENQKLYGCFGIYHTLQGCTNSFANRIKANPFINGKMVSLIEFYTNCHIALPSQYLPKYLADKETYTRLHYGNDNLFFGYINGIEDFKRLSNDRTINLFKLSSSDSPYNKSNRGLHNFSFLNTLGGIPINKTKVTTDYAQYLYFVNGANWIKPEKTKD